MRPFLYWLPIAFVLALCSVLNARGQAVTASQGKPDPHEFQSPMVLEMPFLLADPARWNDTWTTEKEYTDLKTFHCEGVFIERLKLKAVQKGQERVQITVSVKLRNPNNNHDKEVYPEFELQNESETIGRLRRAEDQARPFLPDGGIKVEESDSATRLYVGESFARDLKSTTKLRIKITLKDI